MNAIERVCKYLQEAGTYYLATVEGDQPRVRPFGVVHLYEGRLYLITGKVKAVSHQIAANPKVEICACKGGDWLRVAATLVNDDSLAVKTSYLEANPGLKAMYKADDDNIQVLYLKDAVATFSSFSAAPETVTF